MQLTISARFFVSVLCSVTVASTCVSAGSAQQNISEHSSDNHRILGAEANFGAAGEKSTSGDFRQLNNRSQAPFLNSSWRRRYLRIELSAAQQFCRIVKGMKAKDVELLAGTTSFKNEVPPNSQRWPVGEQEWLYIFGRSPVLARLVFKGGVCVAAKPMDAYYDYTFEKWTLQEIRKYAGGKTEAQIAKFAGSDYVKRAVKPEEKNELADGDEIISYENMGNFSTIDLVMKKNLCVGTMGVDGSNFRPGWLNSKMH